MIFIPVKPTCLAATLVVCQCCGACEQDPVLLGAHCCGCACGVSATMHSQIGTPGHVSCNGWRRAGTCICHSSLVRPCIGSHMYVWAAQNCLCDAKLIKSVQNLVILTDSVKESAFLLHLPTSACCLPIPNLQIPAGIFCTAHTASGTHHVSIGQHSTLARMQLWRT